MKRILNLNGISGSALVIIAMTGLVVPGALLLISRLFDRGGLHLPALEWLARFFWLAGGVLLVLFFVLVVLEHIQDAIIYRQYLQGRRQAVEGECPFCGYRPVRAFEHSCPVCGETLNRS